MKSLTVLDFAQDEDTLSSITSVAQDDPLCQGAATGLWGKGWWYVLEGIAVMARAARRFDGTIHVKCIKVHGHNLFHLVWWRMVKTQMDGISCALWRSDALRVILYLCPGIRLWHVQGLRPTWPRHNLACLRSPQWSLPLLTIVQYGFPTKSWLDAVSYIWPWHNLR